MIEMTNCNGKFVRISANYNVENGTAVYTVCRSGGVKKDFSDFAAAAQEYRRIADEICKGEEVV